MEKGKVVVVEGACDGIGKTTQYNLLIERLKTEGYDIFNYHFPSYGTKRGEKVEKFLRGEFGDPKNLSPYFIHELYAEDRKETWNEILKPKYDGGVILFFDRYTTSSAAYQPAFLPTHAEKIRFMDHVERVEYKENGLKRPDLVLFLTADFDLVTKLRNNRKINEGILQDVFERDVEIQRKIYETAILASKYLGWSEIICDDGIDRFRSIEDIHEEAYSRIRKLIL